MRLLEIVEQIDVSQVECELRAQINSFKSIFGTSPAHIDGHNHCQVFSVDIARVIAKVCTDFNITCIRLPFEQTSIAVDEWLRDTEHQVDSAVLSRRNRVTAFNKHIVAKSIACEQIYRDANLRFAHVFIGLYLLLACDVRQSDALNVYSALLRRQLSEASKQSKDPYIVEIMCHPGEIRLSAFPRISQFRVQDLLRKLKKMSTNFHHVLIVKWR
jgi:predicted glycoside hydrolase/deacetylase ChbG (UPF0249 family)